MIPNIKLLMYKTPDRDRFVQQCSLFESRSNSRFSIVGNESEHLCRETVTSRRSCWSRAARCMWETCPSTPQRSRCTSSSPRAETSRGSSSASTKSRRPPVASVSSSILSIQNQRMWNAVVLFNVSVQSSLCRFSQLFKEGLAYFFSSKNVQFIFTPPLRQFKWNLIFFFFCCSNLLKGQSTKN